MVSGRLIPPNQWHNVGAAEKSAPTSAGVAELVDASDSKSDGRLAVRVQVPPPVFVLTSSVSLGLPVRLACLFRRELCRLSSTMPLASPPGASVLSAKHPAPARSGSPPQPIRCAS